MATPGITRNGKTFAEASMGITDRNALGALAQTYQNPGIVAPVVPTTPVVPPPAAPGSAAYIYQQSDADKASDDQYNSIGSYYKDQFNTEVDPNKVYKSTLQRYQSQIDSINNMFNDQLNQSRVTNAPGYKAREDQSRIGQVMGGLVSSPMGQAQTNQVQDANAQEQAAAEAIINDKRSAAIAGVYGQVQKSSEDELAAKRLAKSKGADELLKHLNEAPTRKAKQISTVAKSLLSQGIDIKSLSPEELDKLAKDLGTDKDTLITSYDSASSEQKKNELEERKVEAEVSNLEGKYEFEAAQKALDRALEEKRISVSWYNATTSRMGETRQAAADAKAEDSKNYDGITIPTTVKSELIFDLKENMAAKKKEKKSLQEFFAIYPEVNTKYLTELFEANQ